MATSGSVNYTMTAAELVNAAFQLINKYGAGKTVSAEDMNFALGQLNRMIKAWQGRGIYLWAKTEGYIFLTKSVGNYTLGHDSTDAYASDYDDTVLTTLASDGSSSATSLTVGTTSGMAAADTIGIVLDSGDMHWTTIVSVDSATTLTITSGLASAAASGANVYTFTSRINKPLKIHSVRRVIGVPSTTTSGQTSEIEINLLSLSEYMQLPMKDADGVPVMVSYEPKLNNGKLYVWPRPSTPSYYFRMTYSRMFEDIDSETNNLDFPSEWLEAITYQLAYRLCAPFGRDKRLVADDAMALLQNMLDWDQETTSIKLQPGLN